MQRLSLIHLEQPCSICHAISLSSCITWTYKMTLWSFPWWSRSRPPGTANLLVRKRPRIWWFTMFLFLGVASLSAKIKIISTSFIILQASSFRDSEEWLLMLEDHPSWLALWFMRPSNGNILMSLCYRIGFGGSPVHLMIMANVLGQISIEISMHPGVVSTWLADELVNKKWSWEARKEVNY